MVADDQCDGQGGNLPTFARTSDLCSSPHSLDWGKWHFSAEQHTLVTWAGLSHSNWIKETLLFLAQGKIGKGDPICERACIGNCLPGPKFSYNTSFDAVSFEDIAVQCWVRGRVKHTTPAHPKIARAQSGITVGPAEGEPWGRFYRFWQVYCPPSSGFEPYKCATR
jgi:hypothetical protein